MLRYDPLSRLTAKECLQHNYFKYDQQPQAATLDVMQELLPKGKSTHSLDEVVQKMEF